MARIVKWRMAILAVALLLPVIADAATEATLGPVLPTFEAHAGVAAKPFIAKRKSIATRSAAGRHATARARRVGYTPMDGLELTPPRTEQEAFEWLERDLALKVGKRRQADDYPEEAVREGWSGTALIDVLVGGNGAIKQIALARSSGFKVLDDQALEMVKRVSKLWVPKQLRGRETSVSVPIGFQMQRL